MDPITLGLIGGSIVGPALGGILGRIMTSGDREKAQQAIEAANKETMSLGLPPDASRPILIQRLAQAGLISPQSEQALQLEQSQVSKIQEDPRLKGAQLQALRSMQALGQTGLSPQERADFADLQRQVAAQQQSSLARIQQEAQMRGQAGGGAEIAAQLAAQQQSANRLSEESQNLGARAAARALQALQSSGAMAGNLRSEDLNLANLKAQAQDRIAQFNLQNMQNVQQRNIAAQNRAQAENLANAQEIARQNAILANQEATRQRQGEQANYENILRRNTQRQNAAANLANAYQGQAAQTANFVGGLGQGLGQAAAAGLQYKGQQDIMDRLYPKEEE